jgi:hypothetical protein
VGAVTAAVQVECPRCANAGRAVRRHCRTCGGVGTVESATPVIRVVTKADPFAGALEALSGSLRGKLGDLLGLESTIKNGEPCD